MKSRLFFGVTALLAAAFLLIQCAAPVAAPPVTVRETVVVKETVVSEKTVVVEATAAPVSGEITVLIVGAPDADGIDPVTGKPIAGVQKLKTLFEAQNPNIKVNIVNTPWGSGSSSYSAKTETMVQAQEACVYMMPAALDYGRRGYLVNLDTFIKNDPTFEDVWGGNYLQQYRGWGPGNPDNQWGLPYRGDNRVIHWDSALFEQWGVEPLSDKPTIEEIMTKAAKMTGKNPVTGEDNYGYWFQGKYAVWQFMALVHALGGSWGKQNPDGTLTVNWDTPENLKAMETFVALGKYAPASAVGADAMPQGFLSDQNIVAIIPEGEPGYYLLPILNDKKLAERFRVAYNLKGADGRGGTFVGGPIAMAASCPNKEAAWVVLKWLAGSPESQQYNFENIGNPPVITGAETFIPGLKDLPGIEAEVIINQNATADAQYIWGGSDIRWGLQDALEAALAGTITPAEAIKQAQARADAYLQSQK